MKLKLLLIISLLSPSVHSAIVTRAAFDIGSGTTKMVVAKVDTETKKVIEILTEVDESVGYKEHLANILKKNKNSKKKAPYRFSHKILNKGLSVLTKFKLEAMSKYKATEFIGAATSTFREVVIDEKTGQKAAPQNAKQFLKSIRKKLGINARIIKQSKEAEIGFWSGQVKSNSDVNDLVVWDIGGGSMQFGTLIDINGKKKFVVYPDYEHAKKTGQSVVEIGATKFANEVIQTAFPERVNTTNSPNPLGRKSDIAVAFAKVFMGSEVKNGIMPKVIADKILSKNTKIFGIGGVHYYAVRTNVQGTKIKGPQFSKYAYGLAEVTAGRRRLESFTDTDFDNISKKKKRLKLEAAGKMSKTEIDKIVSKEFDEHKRSTVTNICLVEGVMKALKIEKMETSKANLAHGLVVNPSLLDD